MGKNSETGMSVGGTSILVIFVLLCLTTFATLSLVSANADLRLTQKAEQSVSSYYLADSLAEEKLAEIDRVLAVAAGDEVAQALSGVPGIHVTPGTATVTVQYQIPMGETQQLAVTLLVPMEPAPHRYRVAGWQVENLAQWEAEEGTLHLLEQQEDLVLFAG